MSAVLPDPLAEPVDVRDIIETDLTDEDITRQLGYAAGDVREALDLDGADSDFPEWKQARLEALLAALKIRSTLDRALTSGQSESSTVSFEGSVLEEIRAEIHRLDPSNELARNGIRNRSRHVRRSGRSTPAEAEER